MCTELNSVSLRERSDKFVPLTTRADVVTQHFSELTTHTSVTVSVGFGHHRFHSVSFIRTVPVNQTSLLSTRSQAPRRLCRWIPYSLSLPQKGERHSGPPEGRFSRVLYGDSRLLLRGQKSESDLTYSKKRDVGVRDPGNRLPRFRTVLYSPPEGRVTRKTWCCGRKREPYSV